MAPAGSPIYGVEVAFLVVLGVIGGIIVLAIAGWIATVILVRRHRARQEERFLDARQRLAWGEALGRLQQTEGARQRWLDTYLDYGRLPQPQVTAYYLFDKEFDLDANRMIPTGYRPVWSAWEPIEEGEQLRVVYQLDPPTFHQAAQRWAAIRGRVRGQEPLIPA